MFFGLQIPVYVVLTLKNFESLFNIQRSYLTQTAYFKDVNKVQIGFLLHIDLKRSLFT